MHAPFLCIATPLWLQSSLSAAAAAYLPGRAFCVIARHGVRLAAVPGLYSWLHFFLSVRCERTKPRCILCSFLVTSCASACASSRLMRLQESDADWKHDYKFNCNLQGHQGNCYSICADLVFMGGQPRPMLFTGSRDKTVRCWDVMEKRCKATLKGHESGIWNLLHKQIKGTSWLFSCSFDRNIRVSAWTPMLC